MKDASPKGHCGDRITGRIAEGVAWGVVFVLADVLVAGCWVLGVGGGGLLI
jgi:hypothetical protein